MQLLEHSPWIWDERNLGHVVVGMNECLAMEQKIPEWVQMGSKGQSTHTFVALLQEVATEIPAGDKIDWVGCPAVPEQALEKIQVSYSLLKIDSTWICSLPQI